MFNAILAVNYSARDAALAAAEAGDGAAPTASSSTPSTAGRVAHRDDRIVSVEIFKASPNGDIIGTPTIYTRTGSTTCTFVDPRADRPLHADHRRLSDAVRCNVLGGCGGGPGRQHRRPRHLHPSLRDPAPDLRGRRVGADVRANEHHADGADPVMRRGAARADRARAGARRVRPARAGVPAAAARPARVRLHLRPRDDRQLRHPRRRPLGAAYASGNPTTIRCRRRQEHRRRRPAGPEGAGLGGQISGITEIRIYKALANGTQGPRPTSGPTARAAARGRRGTSTSSRAPSAGTPVPATTNRPRTRSAFDPLPVRFVTPFAALVFFGPAGGGVYDP